MEPRNAAEQQSVATLMKKIGVKKGCFWIGISDRAVEGMNDTDLSFM